MAVAKGCQCRLLLLRRLRSGAALRMAASRGFGSFTEHTLGESVRIHVVLMDGKNAELLKDGMGMVRGY